ncbi:MAG: glycosyltransferase [Dysgonomonas sp.]
MKKKVAFFVTNLNAGGIENYLLRFIVHCYKNIDVQVYCKSGKFGELEKQYRDAGAKLKSYKVGYFNIFSFWKLYNELKRENFDAVCDFTGNFAGMIMFLAYKAKIKKRIAFYRGSTNHFKETSLRLYYNRYMKHLINKYATNILSNSVAALDFFYPDRNADSLKFEVIYNGIDAKRFLSTKENLKSELSIPANSFVVGHIGRFNKAKNHELIIKVAIALCKKHDDIHFILCGKDVDTNLSEIVNANNLEQQIHLLGYRNDVIKVLNSLNCFYFPSITEGQPNALIEALICGLPFVASDISPIKETIPAEYHDQLVNIDSIEQSCNKILDIYTGKTSFNLANWALEHYNSDILFNKFYDKL